MSLYNPDGTAPVVSTGLARIERALPFPGEVLARTGGRVEPEDVVAKALVPAPPRIVNVAQALGIPARHVKRALRRQVGNRIRKGRELASSRSLLGPSCATPVGGIITSVDPETGYVTIAPDPVEHSVKANVRGIVMEVLPYRGVVIETPGAQVYGAVGIGNERNGVLRLMVVDPAERITPDQIDARSAYAILICGATIDAASLRRAVQEQVCGIIVGGIEERELRAFMEWQGQNAWYTGSGGWHFPATPYAADPGLTLVITEGFGVRPMAAPIFELLSSRDRQEALIEGNTTLRQPLRRPRVVVPLVRSTGAQTEATRLPLVPGCTVRLLDTAHLGQVATVKSVAATPRRIAANISVPAVEVAQEDAPSFWLPQTAVEVLA